MDWIQKGESIKYWCLKFFQKWKQEEEEEEEAAYKFLIVLASQNFKKIEPTHMY